MNRAMRTTITFPGETYVSRLPSSYGVRWGINASFVKKQNLRVLNITPLIRSPWSGYREGGKMAKERNRAMRTTIIFPGETYASGQHMYTYVMYV